MARFIYVDGRYRRSADAAIHAEDRGFQFADSVYEVCEVKSTLLVDETRHLDRLERSLAAIEIPMPMSRAALRHVMREVVRRNRVVDGSLYLQISRGAGPRDFAYPPPGTRPTVVCLARAGARGRIAARAETGIAVATMPDIRWGRCDIKTTMLLPACLSKHAAGLRGAREAWLVDRDGLVTEGASSNAWIVTTAGEVVTRALGPDLLAGVTRATVLDVIARGGLTVIERPFAVAEAKAASEAFVTSASNTVMPVVEIDGTPVGNGHPGAVARLLRERFHATAENGQ